MDKAQQALHTVHENPTLCIREGMLYVTTLLPLGRKRVFSNRRQGYNGLAWGIRILATFTNLSLIREDGEVVEGHEVVKSEVIACFQ